VTIRMAVVKAVLQLVCLVPNHPGENRLVDTKPGGIKEVINLLLNAVIRPYGNCG
jgi:hypothetical protein